MRQPGDTIEGSIMTGLVEGFRSIGRPECAGCIISRHVSCHTRQKTLVITFSSMQPTAAKQRRRNDMT